MGSHGFDPARDIQGIIINRWGHGYAYWYSPLYDEFLTTGGEPPHLRARQPFGHIAIANTASGADDTTELAIDMAARALGELHLILACNNRLLTHCQCACDAALESGC